MSCEHASAGSSGVGERAPAKKWPRGAIRTELAMQGTLIATQAPPCRPAQFTELGWRQARGAAEVAHAPRAARGPAAPLRRAPRPACRDGQPRRAEGAPQEPPRRKDGTRKAPTDALSRCTPKENRVTLGGIVVAAGFHFANAKAGALQSAPIAIQFRRPSLRFIFRRSGASDQRPPKALYSLLFSREQARGTYETLCRAF